MATRVYTPQNIRLHRVVSGYYASDILESGTVEDGNYDLHTYSILRANDGTSWNVRLDSSVPTATTLVKTLAEARVLIAEALNRMNRMVAQSV